LKKYEGTIICRAKIDFNFQTDPTSFLSIDTENRVLRFDSFSKVLSSGLRVGFVTGAKPLIHRIELHVQASVLHTSALPQVFFLSLQKLCFMNKNNPPRLPNKNTKDFFLGPEINIINITRNISFSRLL
jgi:hypothetical protein